MEVESCGAGLFSSHILNDMCTLQAFFAKQMLHRSSIISKIVINIMIIEVMYKAKLPHSFVDSRPRSVIARIRSLAGYTVQSQSSTADPAARQ